MAPPPPPPPPPPLCIPFISKKKTRRLTYTEGNGTESFNSQRSSIDRLERAGSYSPTATLTSRAEKLTFSTDTESYYDAPRNFNQAREDRPVLKRANTTKEKPTPKAITNNGGGSRKWGYGYGWGIGKKDKEKERDRQMDVQQAREETTLVGSALERKMNDVDSYKGIPDTTERLTALREYMHKDNLDYYVIPSEDAHGSEYVAINDKRREWISGFTGSAGVAVVSKTSAYLVTDSRYWLQAQRQIDRNWLLVAAGSVDGPKDWIEWLVDRASECRIGIDARMLSHEKAVLLNNQLAPKRSKLYYPPQNFVDLIWKDKPSRSREPVFVQPLKFTGMEAGAKIAQLRQWIQSQPPTLPSYTKRDAIAGDKQVCTLLSSLSSIAWLLNLRGDDIPFNPVFHSYLFVSAEQAILFIEPAKVSAEVDDYLASIGVQRQEYNAVWTFLRQKSWGEGRVIICPQTSYAISLMLTSLRYTVLPPIIEEWKAVKNQTEVEGMKAAYIRDGVAYVRWLAWLEYKMSQGYDITEYEAAWRLTEFRRMGKYYMGLAYENISATGKNAALPHYTPHKSDEIMIRRDAPYLNDSGGQYRDGTCDTTRTIHFGRPTAEQCEAFTRVLQGHIAIDSAIFPEGTNGAQLDILARKALWQDGLNYMHGTGHGFGSYLNVHEGPHGFSSQVPLVPGHVITNEPGYYKEDAWGMRIESALFVKRIKTKGEFNGDIWLGFERLTCVPIQTKMIKDSMLSKEERQWLKDHNRRCLEKLEPYLREDKRALKWLRREAERSIGLASPGPGGISIDWD
ncbi:hypothetical protein EW026_g4233 [Hermanssonia centrifuga]|uniref:Creatinase/aminopeptidase n=1 Tax=Hermanssonia centrifuga TaxID=98765 RepID=A0A4S4KIZ9_9APHY|nr:hypothetical protein EW026_g4233 [Hermanssonia centrifuga]